MALFDKMELSLGFESITSMIEVKDAEYKTLGGTGPLKDTDDVGATSIAPNIHLIVPVNDQFAWGVNAYSNFNLGLAGSYRLNQQWSFGAGLDLIYGQGTFKRIAGSGFGPNAGKAIVDIDKADGFAVGFNVGTVFELDENNRFGLSYRVSPEFEAKDDYGQKVTRISVPYWFLSCRFKWWSIFK